jgi:hypothetical protein
MRRIVLAAISALCFVGSLASPSTASASHDPTGAPFDEDFVTGSAVRPLVPCTPGCNIILVFDAHSGPSGENAAGTVRIDIESPPGGGIETFATAQVTCLDVSANRATIGGLSQSSGSALAFFAEDNDGAGQDGSALLPIGGTAPPVCPAFPSTGLPPIFAGDLTVHDAVPPPTSKAQCRNGGWRDFSGFKNQGECVAFVERGPR